MVEATTSRAIAPSTKSLTLIDFGTAFLRHLVTSSGSPEFGGGHAALEVDGITGHLGAFLARWQSDQGDPLGEELHIFRRSPFGDVEPDDAAVIVLLREPVSSVVSPPVTDAAVRREDLVVLTAAVEAELSQGISRQRMLNDLVLLEIAEAI